MLKMGKRGILAATVTICLLAPGLASADDSGAAAGAIAGGTAGAVVGGPVGAAVGAGAGAVIGGATSGPRTRVIEERETTGTVVVPQPSCESRTVQSQNSFGDTKTTTTTNCP